MADLSTELIFASYNGVPFLMDSHNMEYGRKVAVHDYPNKKYIYVEDLGQKLRTFQVEAVITGDVANYIIKREALVTVLNLPGAGILTHPFLGALRVTVLNYTLNEAPRELGVARFNITFQEANINIFPLASPSNSATINDLVNSLQSYLLGAFITTFTTLYKHNISFNANKCQKISDQASQNISNTKSINQDSLNDFNNTNKIFVINKFSLAQNPTELGNSIYSFLDAYNNLSDNAQNQYNLNKDLFYFGQDDMFPNVETGEIVERKKDHLAINSQVNSILLSNMYRNATQIEFLDDVQLNVIADDLEQKYQYLTANNNLDEDTLVKIEDIRLQVINYFNNLLANISKVFSTNINFSIPLTVLLYGYYENFNYEDEIISLNNIFDPSVITGDIKLLSTSVM